MWKTVLAGSTALAIAGATLAYAQQGPAGSDFAPRWRPSAADITALGDARIAALHAGLKLTADQEKNWPAVESALRGDVMTQRGAALKKLAEATGPLYKSLDEAQKHRFVMLARLGGERRMQGQHGWKHRGPGGFERGPIGPEGGPRPQ